MRIQVFLLVMLAQTVSCTVSPIKPMTQVSWQENMRKISKSFSTLIKYAYSGNSYLNPENKELIEDELKTMTELTEEIHQKGKNLNFDKDPVLKYVTRNFNRDMSIAYLEMKSGHPQFSRSVVRATSNYCISCHTRDNQGQRDTSGFLNVNMNGLTNLEKADYFAAVRQFPQALDAYDQALTNSQFVNEHQKDWAVGMKKSLAIAVRVERNPSLALELISRVFDARSVPLQMREAANTWRVAVKEWRDFDKVKAKSTPMILLKEARLLIKKAQDSIAQSWNSEAGLIYYLRASTILHDILRQQKGLDDYSETLYLSGLAAEGLNEINLWTFDEIYYESCIRYKPHSENSKKCFSRLETLQLFSPKLYPTDDNNKLKELRDLAI